METITLDTEHMQEAVARAADVLRSGGVVLYPTDTLYGLGADAFSDAAVAKVYEIKKRDEGKPMHCVVADIAAAGNYAEINERARLLAEKFLPGALTLVLPKKPDITAGIAHNIETIGFRVPDNEFCLLLARSFGAPYTTTSANLSSAPQGRRLHDIYAQLGANIRLIDLVIDAGELPMRLPSTVVDVSAPETTILREGTIPAYRIREALGI